ncbi:hypothetical protein [Mesonia phycicola]|uniref:hypothetical protein n=1 Tax=Mesonia phycicola TaxID=579105 RepID=UPI001160657E|nr:hypothetical protein [Mesonia phycicola]
MDTLKDYKIQFSDKSVLMPNLHGGVNKAEIDFTLQPTIQYSFYEELLEESKIINNLYQLNAELQNEEVFIQSHKKEFIEIKTKGISIVRTESTGANLYLIRIDNINFKKIVGVEIKISKGFNTPGWSYKNKSKGKTVEISLMKLDSTSVVAFENKIIANKEEVINFDGNGWLKFDLSEEKVLNPNTKFLGLIIFSKNRITYKTSPANSNSDQIYKMDPVFVTKNFSRKLVGWKMNNDLDSSFIKFKIILEK